MKITKIILLLLLPLVGGIFFSTAVHAITVSPVIVDHEITPGMKTTGKLLITNDADEKQTYYISIQKFMTAGEEGEQQYLGESEVTELPSWFRFDEKSFTVEANQTKEMPYIIDVPPNARPGGYYAAVFFSTIPENKGGQSTVGMAAKTGIVFLVKIKGDVKEGADIESFEVGRSIISYLPVTLNLRIRNTGSVHLRPTGTLEIRNMWGGIVARVPANPKKGAVLPNSVRRLDTQWIKSADMAQGGFRAGVANEWRNFALGRYTVTIDVKYGDKNTPLEARFVTFWVLPWRLGLLLLGLIVMLLFGIKFYNKLIISSALKQISNKKPSKRGASHLS